MKPSHKLGCLLFFVLLLTLFAPFLLPVISPMPSVASAVCDIGSDNAWTGDCGTDPAPRVADPGPSAGSEVHPQEGGPTLTLSPSRGRVGASVTLTGSGFGECKRDRVSRVWFAETDYSPALDWKVPDNVYPDPYGKWVVKLPVPTGQRLGVYYVCAMTADCGIQACNTFEVTSSAGPEEVVSAPYAPEGPAGGQVGQRLQFSTGGAACMSGGGVEYRYDWGDGTLSVWMDPAGAQNASYAWPAKGTYSVSAQARCLAALEDMSAWSDRTPVTIYEVAPTIVLMPAEGCPGATIKITGSGFAARDTVPVGALTVDGVACNTSAIAADELGGWQTTITAPADLPLGGRNVVATTTAGSRASATYIVLAAPKIKISPSSGRPGVLVSLSGSGFIPDDKIPAGSLSFGGVTWDVSTISVGASGEWTALVNVPSDLVPGEYRVTAKTARGCEAETTYTVPSAGETETVSTPNAPQGPTSGEEGQSLSFSASGAKSSLGHRVQYQFDWGDGTQSQWVDSGTASHAWSVKGPYAVKARARCAIDNAIVSAWSRSTSLTVLAPASFAFGNLTIVPAVVAPGGNVTVAVTVKNIGQVEGSVEVPLQVSGVVEKVQKVTLAASGNATVAFSIGRGSPGNYSVAVGNLTGVFEVVPSESGVNLPMVGGTIFAVIILLLLAWLVRRLARSI